MKRLSYPTETVLPTKITRNRIVPSFKDSPRRPLGRRPKERGDEVNGEEGVEGRNNPPRSRERGEEGVAKNRPQESGKC